MSLFGRKYKLTVGRPTKFPESFDLISVGRPIKKDSLLYTLTIDQSRIEEREFREFTDFQIQGHVKYTKSKRGKGLTDNRFKITGLNKESRDYIQEGDIIYLDAGYESDEELPRIFSGQVLIKEVDLFGVNNDVILTVGQYFDLGKEVRVSRSYPPNSNAYDIIYDLVVVLKQAGVTFGSDKLLRELAPSLSKLVFNIGYVPPEGSILDFLDEFLNIIKYRYYFVNSVMYIEPEDLEPLTASFEVDESNLKRAPRIVGTKVNNGVVDRTDTGYEFTLFLDGRVDLSSTLNITFGEYEGSYKVTSIMHKFDYEGNVWDTIVTCKRESIKDD
jgi:hypothetical protein